MAVTGSRSSEEIRVEIEAERDRLAGAVGHLRDELSEAANVTAKLASKLPLAAAAAASTGFVLAGGIGATMRYFARRGREPKPKPKEKARLGWSLRR